MNLNHIKLGKGVRSFVGKKVMVILFSFIVYNLALVLLLFLVFSYKLPERYRQKLNDRIALAEIPGNFISGKTANPELFQIDIKHKHLRRLAYVRSVSLKLGVLYDWERNSVPATIRYNGENYQVKLSLKGRLSDHWDDEEMFSLKIKVSNDRTIMGMKNFALQHPKTRFYINEWILHKLFNYAGLLNLRYDFIAVSINGKGSHIYALEEGLDKRLIEHNELKEGAIFKFDRDFYWNGGDLGGINEYGLAQDLYGAGISPVSKRQTLEDPTQSLYFHKAKSLIEAFRQNRLQASDVFDIHKMGMYFALIDLIGYAHPSTLDNIRFYYNPTTSLIEPIIHDAGSFIRLSTREKHPSKRLNSGMVGSERNIGSTAKHDLPLSWKSIVWFGEIFKDQKFYGEYIKALEKVSQREFLDEFFSAIDEQLVEKENILHRDYPIFSFKPKPILYENQDYIRESLNPSKLINIYLHESKSAANQLQLEITNNQNFPVEVICAIFENSSKRVHMDINEIIQANIESTPVERKTIELRLPDNVPVSDSLMNQLKFQARILGASHSRSISLTAHTYFPNGRFENLSYDPGWKDLDFVVIDTNNARIFLLEGEHFIHETICLPEGFQVMVKENTSFNFTGGAGIVSRSPISFIGSRESPILIRSLDSISAGIFVFDVEEMSKLRYVRFEQISPIGQQSIMTDASITFINAPVEIDHCLFQDHNSLTSSLQIINSDYTIDNSIFQNSRGNSFSTSFSEGYIRNSTFVNSEKHALSISCSRFHFENLSISRAALHGLNVHSKSTVIGSDLKVSGVDVAVSSEDFSKVLINHAVIERSRIGLAAMQRKPEFGPSSLEIEGMLKMDAEVGTHYLVDPGNRMIISDIQIENTWTADRKDVPEIPDNYKAER